MFSIGLTGKAETNLIVYLIHASALTMAKVAHASVMMQNHVAIMAGPGVDTTSPASRVTPTSPVFPASTGNLVVYRT